MTEKKKFYIHVWDSSSYLVPHEYVGTLVGARMWARKQAREALPKWEHAGYGPRIRIFEPDGAVPLVEERL